MKKALLISLFPFICNAAPAVDPNSCQAWLDWLGQIEFFERLRVEAVAEIEKRDGYYAAVDADIEWRAKLKAIMNNPPGGRN